MVTQLRLFARRGPVVWRCPRCGYQVTQPRTVKASMHLCGKGQRLVHLERADDDA